jgi:arsenate reductase-like glutaredoxin family protein
VRKEGWRGEDLAQALYGEPNLGALKALLHRLREKGLRVSCAPYRLETPPPSHLSAFLRALSRGDLEEALARYRGPLLPQSQAPGVEALRLELEEALRRAVLAKGEVESLFLLADRLGEDLEVWEALLERLPPEDPRLPLARARVARLRREWGL